VPLSVGSPQSTTRMPGSPFEAALSDSAVLHERLQSTPRSYATAEPADARQAVIWQEVEELECPLVHISGPQVLSSWPPFDILYNVALLPLMVHLAAGEAESLRSLKSIALLELLWSWRYRICTCMQGTTASWLW